MNLKLLKLLQNNNTPLIITVEEKEKQATITRDGVSVEEQSKDIFKHLKEALAFYPEEVWINREKMERTQWPGLAQRTDRGARRKRRGEKQQQESRPGSPSPYHRLPSASTPSSEA